jgi:ABC-type Fe3+/spermidine/putrescine transport system ATPase subunit
MVISPIVTGTRCRQFPAVEARGLRRAFGDVIALDRVTLSVAEDIFALLGPWCGKTTPLRAIAGLDLPDAGVAVARRPVRHLPAHRRP